MVSHTVTVQPFPIPYRNMASPLILPCSGVRVGERKRSPASLAVSFQVQGAMLAFCAVLDHFSTSTDYSWEGLQ
jgi:hypothetical protein